LRIQVIATSPRFYSLIFNKHFPVCQFNKKSPAKTASNRMIVLPLKQVLEDEKRLSQDFKYPITPAVKEMM